MLSRKTESTIIQSFMKKGRQRMQNDIDNVKTFLQRLSDDCKEIEVMKDKINNQYHVIARLIERVEKLESS